jgi:hypothetical protein
VHPTLGGRPTPLRAKRHAEAAEDDRCAEVEGEHSKEAHHGADEADLCGRFREPASSQAQRPTNAKSAIVSRMTTGTRTTPSRSWGTKNVASLHHESPVSLIPCTLGKKTAALAVTAAPTQRSVFRRRVRASTRRSVFQFDPAR